MNEDDVFAGLQHQMELEEQMWRESDDFCAWFNMLCNTAEMEVSAH